MNKKEIYNFTSKVYRRLDNDSFVVKFFRSKDFQGLCYQGSKFIELNPSGDILSTLIHEMLHDIYPLWSEKKVAAQEKLIMHQLSHKQMANLMVAVGKTLKRAHPKHI